MRGEVKRTKSLSFILKSQLVIFKTKKIKKCQYKASIQIYEDKYQGKTAEIVENYL